MRHVADETRLARIAPDDLRPLIPRCRTPVRHEESQQLVRTLAPSKAHKRSDRAQLVGRVIVPRLVSVPSFDEFAPIALESRPN